MAASDELQIEIFSTTPQSKDRPRETYVQQIIDVARWSEEAGCTAILVYTDNSLVDAWLVSQIIIQNTQETLPSGRRAARLYAPLHGGKDGLDLRTSLSAAHLPQSCRRRI